MGIPVMTKEQLVRAIQFIKENARPLEKTMYAYEFEGGPAEDVIREL